MRRYPLYLALAASALAVAFAGSARAGNGYAFGQNVDPHLVASIASQHGNGDYHVLVFGSGLNGPKGPPAGVSWRDSLDVVGAQSATLTADQIAQLSASPGVQFVTEDVPMAPTGTTAATPPSSPQDQLKALQNAVDQSTELHGPAGDPVRKTLDGDLSFGNPTDPHNKYVALSQLDAFVADVQAATAPAGPITGDDSSAWVAAANALVAAVQAETLSPQDELNALQKAVDQSTELHGPTGDPVRKTLDGDLSFGNPTDPKNATTAAAGLSAFVGDVQAETAPAGPITVADSTAWVAAAKELLATVQAGTSTPSATTAPAPAPTAPLPGSSLVTQYPQIDGATGFWANGDTGSGVGIAIIDSGVTPRADFGNRLVQVQLPTQDGTQLNDAVGHGSAVAGVAAGDSPDGQYMGVAPGATVYAINVARSDGVYTSDVIAGLEWVLQNAKQDHIGVVNLSLSQVTPSSYYTNTLDAAIDVLWQHGIVVVVSSGNFGPNHENFAPANDPWAITVGASDSNGTVGTGDDTLASFSSYGTTPDGFSKPEIVAPGRHIWTTIPGSSAIAQEAPAGYLLSLPQGDYVKISGTSFSAPQVSGAVALILAQRPNLSPDQVKWILTQGERPLSGSNAGALDLGNVAGALAHPDNANKGYHWSNWAHPGANTDAFLNSFQGQASMHHAADLEKHATDEEQHAQDACAKAAGSTPNPKWQDCGTHLDNAAAAWDGAAQSWSDAGFPASAAVDETNAANDWQLASSAWTSAGNTTQAAADVASQAAAWDHVAAWDAAAWDVAAWDHVAAWDAAAWDAAAWDAATWDAAAWDAAAWDAAAWD